jgi:phosphate/phosphite/phosphonate ABC transporter binding protein
MQRFIILFLLLTSTFLSIFCSCSSTAQAAKLGVLALRGKEAAIKSWGPLTDYLTQETGEKFELVPLGFDKVFSSVYLMKVDYVIVNSGFSSILIKKYGVKPLATRLNYRQGRALKEFGGVIFVKTDSPIKDVADIKGKSFMVVDMASFGGAQMAFRHLIDKGINPFKDFASMPIGGTHDKVVMSVLNGKADAGTIRSDIIEQMEAEGKIKMSDIRVLDKVKDDFAFVHSTILYPEWPIGATKKSNAALNSRVTNALLALKPDHPAAKASKSAGWTQPLDYTPVADCLGIVSNAP